MSRGGKRVGGGRLRVDAARAVTKLREYQLPDPTAWTLEVARAAVLLGASALHIEADSDDVWIGWSGTAVAEGDLVRLFDDLVGGGAERRAQRLLATGVNTALALDPRFVDVWSIGARSARVRYTPHLYRVSDEGRSEALASTRIEHGPRPEALLQIEEGGAVHVRRALDLAAMGRLLSGRVPPEVEAVHVAACALRIAVHATPRPAPAPPSLVRIAEPPSAASPFAAHAEILPVELAQGAGILEWCELGVALCREELLPGMRLEARMAIRVRLDAASLPTNAARSAVRDEPLIEEGRRYALELVTKLIEALVDEIERAVEKADHGRAHALRDAALSLVHGHLRLGMRHGLGEIAARVRPLTEVPLLRDALGRNRSIAELAAHKPTAVFRGVAPVHTLLSPWLGDVPWIPRGDRALSLFLDEPPEGAEKLIEHAEARTRARAAFLERAELDHRFAPPDQALAIATFERVSTPENAERPHPLDLVGLEGRVAILPVTELSASSPRPEMAEITFLLLRRPIRRVRVSSEIPFAAVVTTGTLRARPDYRDLLDEDAVERVVRAVRAAVVYAAEHPAHALAPAAAAPPLPKEIVVESGPGLRDVARPALIATLRAAVRLELRLHEDTYGESEAVAAALSAQRPLWRVPVFERWEGDALSVDALRQLAHREGVVGTTPLGTATHAPVVGRTLLRVGGPEAETVVRLCAGLKTRPTNEKKSGRAVHVVAYTVADARPRYETELRGALTGVPSVLYFHALGFVAVCAVRASDSASELLLRHAGRPIRQPRGWRAPPGWTLVADDDALIPTSDFATLADETRLAAAEYDASTWQRRFSEAAIDHLLGKHRPDFSTPETPFELLMLLARGGELGARAADVAALPVIGGLDGLSRSFSDYRAAGGGTARFVDPALQVQPGIDFRAMRMHPADAARLGSLFGVVVTSATDEAREHIKRTHAERTLAAFLTRPVAPPAPMPPDAVEVRGPGLRGWARPSRAAELTLLVAGRAFLVRQGPDAAAGLEARLDLDAELVDLERLVLHEMGASRLKGALRDGRLRLLRQHFGTGEPLAIEAHPALAVLALAFVEELPSKTTKPVREVLDVLLDAPMFPWLAEEPGRTSIRAGVDSDGFVRLTQGLDGWIGPAHRPHALDRSVVLSFPDAALSDTLPWTALARKLAHQVGRPKDVTKEARRLLEARNARRDTRGSPTLPAWVDRRFVVSLSKLAERSAEGSVLETVLPQGEAALVGQAETRLMLVGREASTRTYGFVPSVLIVARSPYEGELDDREAQKKLEEAVQIVVAEALRWTADNVPEDAWPPEVRAGVRRAALLGGAVHLARLEHVPLFPTTGGQHVTFDRLRGEVNRFGDLWVVPDAEVRLVPFDPERSALILNDPDRLRLHAVLPCRNGAEELALDDELRRNLARPRLGDPTPTRAERERGLDALSIPIEGGAAWVVPLLPGQWRHRGLETFVAGKALGRADDECAWPTWARIDSTELTPDRVHGAPREDHALQQIRAQIADAVEASVLTRFVATDPFQVVVDRELSRLACNGTDYAMRGILRCSVAAPRSEVTFHDAWGPSERTLIATAPHGLVAVPVPMTGEILVAGMAASQIPTTALESLARRAYLRILGHARDAWDDADQPRRELARALLVRAAIDGHLAGLLPKPKSGKSKTPPAWASEPLPFLAGARRSLHELHTAIGQQTRIVRVSDAEVESASKLAPDAILLVRAESLPARIAAFMLHERSVTFAELVRDEAPPVAPPTQPRAAEAGKAQGKKAAGKKADASPPIPKSGTTKTEPDDALLRRITAYARAATGTAVGLGTRARAAPLAEAGRRSIALAATSRAWRAAAEHPGHLAATAALWAAEALDHHEDRDVAAVHRRLVKLIEALE